MASVKVSERVEAGAEAVWDLLRDFGGPAIPATQDRSATPGKAWI